MAEIRVSKNRGIKNLRPWIVWRRYGYSWLNLGSYESQPEAFAWAYAVAVGHVSARH